MCTNRENQVCSMSEVTGARLSHRSLVHQCHIYQGHIYQGHIYHVTAALYCGQTVMSQCHLSPSRHADLSGLVKQDGLGVLVL